MKSRTASLSFDIQARMAFQNITTQVEAEVRQSGVREGLVLVNAMHITASVFINDNEGGLHDDYKKWLERLAPHAPTNQYRHNDTGEDNADAHMKRQIMGREVVVAITKGALDLGPWEQIFYGEFDGRRRKRVLVKIIGEGMATARRWFNLVPFACAMIVRVVHLCFCLAVLGGGVGWAGIDPGGSFVNFETAPVHPLAL